MVAYDQEGVRRPLNITEVLLPELPHMQDALKGSDEGAGDEDLENDKDFALSCLLMQSIQNLGNKHRGDHHRRPAAASNARSRGRR